MDYGRKLLTWLLLSLIYTAGAAELRSESSSVYAWVIVVLVLVAVGLLAVLVIEIVIIYKIAALGGVPCRSIWLGQLLLLGITLSYLTLIAFIFQPTTVSCSILRFSLGTCYILMQSVLLMKILIVLSPKTKAGFLKLGHQWLILLLLWTVQIVINIQWLLLKPSDIEPLHDGVIICKSTYTSSLFNDILFSFIYIFLMGLVLCIVTMKTYLSHRKLNGKPNSEAKWVLITSCITTAAWLAWIIVGALMPDAAMAALAIGLWVTATSTLLIMFLPKVHKLATLKNGEFYIDDDMPAIIQYNQNGEAIEMDVHDGSVVSPPSYHAESVTYAASDSDGGQLLTNGTLDRPPRLVVTKKPPSVILEEKSNMSVSSVGPSPSVIYNTSNPEKVHFNNDPHALELQHPTSRSVKYNNFGSLSRSDSNYSNFTPPQRYYTIGGHGRHSGANSVIGVPRYEKRYIQVSPTAVHRNSHMLEPQYVREVIASPHHHIDSERLRYPRYAGSSSAESHRYVGSSSGSGLESPYYNNAVGRSASVIGAARYEGHEGKHHLNGHVNQAFTLKPNKGRSHAPPVQYVEVAPRKAASVVGVPSYKTKVLRPAEPERRSLSGSRRTLSQQDLKMELTRIPPSNGTLLTSTLPRSTRFVYKPVANGTVLPVEQRQRAFSDDILERSSVY